MINFKSIAIIGVILIAIGTGITNSIGDGFLTGGIFAFIFAVLLFVQSLMED